MKARWEVRLFETNRRIAETELMSSALTQTLIALMKAGGDTSEAQQCLWKYLDDLRVLRYERALFHRFAHHKVRTALRSQPKERGA